VKTEKNEDEIDESYKSQLKFKYEVHLLNYTINTKKTWAFGCFTFLKT